MKKIYLFAILLMVLVSCSYDSLYRTITLEIPEHPWERYDDIPLWYNLCWTDYHGISELHVEHNLRTVSIRIPLGRTVPVCAYPLGEMLPFGCVVTPLDTEGFFILNQNDGFIADILLNVDPDTIENLNYHKLSSVLNDAIDDYRFLDVETLTKDILNGNLKQSSIKIKQPVVVPGFPIPSGIWVSESVFDSRLVFRDNMSEELELQEGIHRYLNCEKNLELRIVVDSDGSIYHYERTPLVNTFKSR